MTAGAPATQSSEKQGFFSRLFGKKNAGVAQPQPAPGSLPAEPEALSCPQCGRPVKEWQKYCLGCGRELPNCGTTDSGSMGSGSSHQNERYTDTDYRPADYLRDDEGTTVLTDGFDDFGGFDDCDDATTVLSEGPRAFLVRTSTNERYDLALPAIVGKGSAATCQVSGNSNISRQHVRISGDFDGFYVEELGATNKTVIDGVILGKGKSCRLEDQSVIVLGNEELVFRVEPAW